MIVKILVLLGLAMMAWSLLRLWRVHHRQAFISTQPLPPSLRPQLKAQHPGWSEAQLSAVEQGLRQFFRICARSPRRFAAMPSKAVDAAWHALILDTRAYQRYCERAFGRLLHHTPAEALPDGTAPSRLRQGLRRSWIGACRDEGLDPRRTTQLPLLFALDAQLGIAGGYRYVPDCRQLGVDRGDTHCGTHLASDSGGASDSADGGDGAGDGGGCGGD